MSDFIGQIEFGVWKYLYFIYLISRSKSVSSHGAFKIRNSSREKLPYCNLCHPSTHALWHDR